MAIDNTKEKRGGIANLKPVQPGEVRNPLGRPKGSRNKISEDFLKDALATWGEHGKDALQKMAAKAPEKFCVMVAGLLPKEIEVKDQLSDLTDEQLDALYEFLDGEVRSEGPGGEAPRQKKGAKPAPVLRTLQ